MIVVDSSVLVMYFSREDGWEAAEAALLEGPVTLDLAVKEVANALWKKVVRGEMPEGTAARVVEDLASGEVLRLEDQRPHLRRAFSIAVRRRTTVYDSLFISLAADLGLRLATADRGQAEAAKAEGVEVRLVPGSLR